MSDTCEHSNPLIHSGTSQRERLIAALDPENTELHGLKEEDWLQFARQYARLINYFGTDDPDKPVGDWQKFFESGDTLTALLKRYGDGDIEPHVALFITFLKLLAYPGQSLNQLPKRHLDYYYRKVLKLQKKPFKPDRVHILFELARNASEELVDVGVPLDAGKDSEGNSLAYNITAPLVVNQGKVASLKSVYVEKKEDGTEILRRAFKTNTLDGIEEEPEEGGHWHAFGNVEWPASDLGFYIASDLLWMEEGVRRISLKFKLSEDFSLPKSHVKAFVTLEEEWKEISVISTDSTASGYNFIIDLKMDSDTDPVAGYSEKAHESGLDTHRPVLKVKFTNPSDYRVLKSAAIEKLRAEVNVSGVESLQMQNELGNVDPSKPFMPFGSRPKVGSKLSVSYPEMAIKHISNYKIEMQWLNVPSNFSEHYRHYLSRIYYLNFLFFNTSHLQGSYNVSWGLKGSSDEDKITEEKFNEYKFDASTISESIKKNGGIIERVESVPEDTLKKRFKIRVESPYHSDTQTFRLFKDTPQVSVDITADPLKKIKGPIQLALTESFYHDLYSKIYVNQILAAENNSADLPNEPYTPLLDKLALSYSAYEDVSFPTDSDSDHSSLMYHQHPFGTSLVKRENRKLVPEYENSELFIGLENFAAGSNISLLFQVAEGTENPRKSNFEEGDISWWALTEKGWLKIEEKDFARNQTNNFLRSGIAEVSVPENAVKNNTLMKTGLHWLRIRLKKEADAVSQFLAVRAQASEAVFENRENSTDHLAGGLPGGRISKLVNPRARIKSVSQPYESFGGEPAESDESFYRRVSERLRHKNRAVSIWDYERLVLEEFPALYKVKCLNHSKWNGTELDERCPGHITLVLIPKLAEVKTEFRLRPAVSSDFMDRVETFINSQNSVHGVIHGANAAYEEVEFEFNVRFKQGSDFSYFKKQVMDDLKRLMAPWVFDDDAAIEFGGSFSEYQVINYLENLSYVDFITEFKMYHKPVNGEFSRKEVVQPSNSMAVLIPVFDESKISEANKCD